MSGQLESTYGEPGALDRPEVEMDAVRRRPLLDPTILRYAVLAYVVVLPVGQLFVFPVNGTFATASDWLLGGVILAGVVELARMSGHYLRNRGNDLPLSSGQERVPRCGAPLHDVQRLGCARSHVGLLR